MEEEVVKLVNKWDNNLHKDLVNVYTQPPIIYLKDLKEGDIFETLVYHKIRYLDDFKEKKIKYCRIFQVLSLKTQKKLNNPKVKCKPSIYRFKKYIYFPPNQRVRLLVKCEHNVFKKVI